MNCISALGLRSLPSAWAARRRWALLSGLFVFAACSIETSESADGPVERDYGVHYRVQVDAANSSAAVTLEIRQSRRQLRELHFPSLSNAFTDFSGDGELEISDGGLRWVPPANGGKLRWRVRVTHQRADDGYDAWLGPDWGMFRAEDIIPRAATRSLKSSTSRTTLAFDLPPGWSVVTEYSGSRDPIVVNRDDRRFDQPTGWIVMGDIGVRRETIAGVRVAIAAPQGFAVRRMDMLALLNWTLPELIPLLPEPLTRLTIVSAGDPMWRGGLSAPASLYIHADRPLISENATSALLHEVMHTALSIRAAKGADWIAEGLAEYYSLELLRRGGAISSRRHATAIAEQANWAKKAGALCSATSTGATTALAVMVFRELDQEIRDKTAGAADLDDAMRQVVASREPMNLEALTEIAAGIIGEPSDVLHIDNLPGCPRITADNPST